MYSNLKTLKKIQNSVTSKKLFLDFFAFVEDSLGQGSGTCGSFDVSMWPADNDELMVRSRELVSWAFVTM